jgi:hypothetical protein
MLSLQKSFSYLGDINTSPVDDVNLKFSLSAKNSTLKYFSSIFDDSFSTTKKELLQVLKSNSYRIVFPVYEYLKNKDSNTIMDFYSLTNGIYNDKELKTLDDITVNVKISYNTKTGINIGQVNTEAICLTKNLDQNILSLLKESDKETPKEEIKKISSLIDQNIFFINRVAFENISKQFLKDIKSTKFNTNSEFITGILYTLRDIVDLSEKTPKYIIELSDNARTVIKNRLNSDDEFLNTILKVFQDNFDSLFDFPISIPEIKIVDAAGIFSVKTSDNSPITKNDLYNYELSLEYSIGEADTEAISKIIHIDWASIQTNIVDNKIAFSFTSGNPIFINKINSLLSVRVKSFDGSLLWSADYDPDSTELKNLLIEVALIYSAINNNTGNKDLKNINKKLRGQILELSKKCLLKDVMVIIEAKNTVDAMWRIVGSTKADSAGNFSLSYPFGTYVAAQAIVSLMPDAPAEIPVDSTKVNESISDDFLYLLLKDADCTPSDKKEDDCDCHSPKKASRLPDHADLIGSDEYSQDIGGSCINLSTPNRTLSEHAYKAIVRTSDPDVANYTLNKNGNTFSLVSSSNKKIDRKAVNLDNPIRWQDAPDNKENLSIYQAITVATGHILHYKSQFKADGYSLGELLYSLPLAPGQKKKIVIFDSSHTLQGTESQSMRQSEGINAGIINDRETTNQLGGSIGESLRGSSSANTSGISAGLGVGGIFGPVGAVLGVSGGVANANSSAAQDSSRTVSQFFGEKLRNSIMQNAEAYRELNASVVTTVQEGQKYAVTTEVVANHNHCHALTMMYFEVLRHYAIYQELSSVEECVFVPLLMTNFTTENIYKWRDVLAQHLLPMHSNTYLQQHFFNWFGNEHPLLKAFDANERIKTNYANIDFPDAGFDTEQIKFIKGNINLRVNIERPKTRYDRILSLRVTTKTTTTRTAAAADPVNSIVNTVNTIKNDFVKGVQDFFSNLFNTPTGASTIPGTGVQYNTEEHYSLVREAIFDSFMQFDANYENVPPAQCIRIINFNPKTISYGPITLQVNALDFFHGGIIDKQLWTTIAGLLNYTDKPGEPAVLQMLDYYFKGQLISEWDAIFYNDILPEVFERLIENIRIDSIASTFTNTTRYRGGERVVQINVVGTTTLSRKELSTTLTDKLKISISNSEINRLKNSIILKVETVNLNYSTKHYNGILFSGYVGENLLSAPTPAAQGVELYIPENNAEQRNPRDDDKYLVSTLIEHLNSNLEYYNRVLWYRLDPDRRFMLLDGFNIQVFNDFGVPVGLRSLASVVKNEMITVTGNSLVFPVSAGYKVSKSHITEKTTDSILLDVSLFDHYKPITPVQPYRISVPTRGVFAEAVQGACNACEKVQSNTSQDWTKFTTDEPTAIAPVVTATPQFTDWKAAFKDFATPIVNIQNAPTAPAPGAGLAGLSELLGKNGVFTDITGLDGNQQNVLKTYLSNQENAKAFATMAKDMATQAHNTGHSDKIMDSLNAAKGSGAINQDDYSKLVKEHLQQQIDGGQSQKMELDKAKKDAPSLSQAAIDAAAKNKDVKATKTDAEGNQETVEIKSNPNEIILAKADGVPKLKQKNTMACWATVAAMMVNWKKRQTLSVDDILTPLGSKYINMFTNNAGLMAQDKIEFINLLGMIGEGQASYSVEKFVDLVNNYGPIWLTVDSNKAEGKISTHAKLLTKIIKTSSSEVTFIYINPSTGTEETEPFADFVKAYEQMVTDNKSDDMFIQIVHFKDKINTVTEGGVTEDVLELSIPKSTLINTKITLSAKLKEKEGTFIWEAQEGNPKNGTGETFETIFDKTGTKTISIYASKDGKMIQKAVSIRVNEPSGKSWSTIADTAGFIASNNISELDPDFKTKVESFKEALSDAGVTDINIKSTFRAKERAYLMHYAWILAGYKCKPTDKVDFNNVPENPNVFIEWKHFDSNGKLDISASANAAKEMVVAFGIDPKNSLPPALDSLHTVRKAIDLTISWTGKIKVKDAEGNEIEIDSEKSNMDNAGDINHNLNEDLIKVGNSFGLYKLANPKSDPNHWSINGG